MKGLLRALKGIIAGYVDCNRLELRDGLSNDAEEGTGGALTFTETPNCTDRLEPRFRDVSVVGNRALKGSLSAKKVSENLEKVPRIWEGEGSWRSEILNPVNNDYWVTKSRRCGQNSEKSTSAAGPDSFFLLSRCCIQDSYLSFVLEVSYLIFVSRFRIQGSRMDPAGETSGGTNAS